MVYKYAHSILGGTFDHLHIGHKKLLDTAFSLSGKLTIGLSTEKIYKEKFLSHLIDPYEIRERELKNYLHGKNYLPRSEITPLIDIFGPSLQLKNIDAIFVTQTTLPNAEIINKERFKKGLQPLEIITVPFVKDESGQTITSERIRLGEIDREGHVYMNLFKKEKLHLPIHLREKLRQPVGKVITDLKEIKDSLKKQSLIITVGDIVSKSVREIGCIPDIEIIDFKTRRSLINTEGLDKFKKMGKKVYNNEPGTISSEVVNVYKEEVKNCVTNHQKQSIIIDGEEDLLTLPAILFAPLHSFIYYGQFNLNAVIQVGVTEEKKKLIAGFLKKFE